MHRQNELMEEIPVSDRLDAVIGNSMHQIKLQKRRKTISNAALTVCLTAVLAGSAFCFTHTSFAENLPIIGFIFRNLQNQTNYKGDMDDSVILLTEPEEVSASEDVENEVPDSPYSIEYNGLTVSVTEAVYDKGGLYLGICLENEKPFPAGLSGKNNIEGYLLSYDMLNLINTVTIKDETGEILVNTFAENLQGSFTDENTFIGISQIDLSQLKYYPTPEEIEAAGIIADDYMNGEDFDHNKYWADIEEIFPRTGEKIEIPDHFTCVLKINNIIGEDFLNTSTETVTMGDGTKQEIEVYNKVDYEGSWEYTLDVSFDEKDCTVKEINALDSDGYGIKSVTRSKYSVWAETNLPSAGTGYFTVLCDADGDLMQNQGYLAETYSTTGRDTSEISVFVCDYDEYMNKLKGYYYSIDYSEKKKEKTFAAYLSEHAKYQAEVTFD